MSPIEKTGILMIHWSKNKDDVWNTSTWNLLFKKYNVLRQKSGPYSCGTIKYYQIWLWINTPFPNSPSSKRVI